MLKRLSVLFPLMALVIAAPAGAQQVPIKIGAILPLTGSGASYGVWMKGGVEMATEETNAAGGIGGRKLEVIYEDHAADASKAVDGMRRLVEVEKVPFTLTSYSAPTLAIQPIGAQNKVVLMNGGGQSDNLANSVRSSLRRRSRAGRAVRSRRRAPTAMALRQGGRGSSYKRSRTATPNRLQPGVRSGRWPRPHA